MCRRPGGRSSTRSTWSSDRVVLENFYSALPLCLPRCGTATSMVPLPAPTAGSIARRATNTTRCFPAGRVSRRDAVVVRHRATADGRHLQDDAHPLSALRGPLPAGVGQCGPRELVHDRLPLDPHHYGRLPQGHPRIRQQPGPEGHERHDGQEVGGDGRISPARLHHAHPGQAMRFADLGTGLR